jgi:hypothetical protein
LTLRLDYAYAELAMGRHLAIRNIRNTANGAWNEGRGDIRKEALREIGGGHHERVSEERLRELETELADSMRAPSARREAPLSLSGLRERMVRGRDLLRRPADVDDELLPTGLPEVDPLLAGGLARGFLTELRGAPSSGRLALVVALLAATTARGEVAALVDLGDQLDPQEAAGAGVDLTRLLWARPTRVGEALAAAEIALGGDFPLVVLELGMPPLPYGTGDEHAWLRLARAARLHRSALLVATPWRLTGSAAGEVLALVRRGGAWIGSGAAPRLLAGLQSRLVCEKSRRHRETETGATREAQLGLRAPSLLLPLESRSRATTAPSRPKAPRLIPAAMLPTRRRLTAAAGEPTAFPPLPVPSPSVATGELSFAARQ